MNKPWQFVLGALLSLCVGAALDEALHMARNRKSEARDRDSNELFQRRLRCKSEADAYARRSSEGNSTFMLVEKVEFSPARHSCIGAFARAMSGRRVTLYSYEAIDILTGETLYSGECAENDAASRIFCGNGRNVELTGITPKSTLASRWLEFALGTKVLARMPILLNPRWLNFRPVKWISFRALQTSRWRCLASFALTTCN